MDLGTTVSYSIHCIFISFYSCLRMDSLCPFNHLYVSLLKFYKFLCLYVNHNKKEEKILGEAIPVFVLKMIRERERERENDVTSRLCLEIQLVSFEMFWT